MNDLPTLIYDDFRPSADTSDLYSENNTLNAISDGNLVEGLIHDHRQ